MWAEFHLGLRGRGLRGVRCTKPTENLLELRSIIRKITKQASKIELKFLQCTKQLLILVNFLIKSLIFRLIVQVNFKDKSSNNIITGSNMRCRYIKKTSVKPKGKTNCYTFSWSSLIIIPILISQYNIKAI